MKAMMAMIDLRTYRRIGMLLVQYSVRLGDAPSSLSISCMALAAEFWAARRIWRPEFAASRKATDWSVCRWA